MNTMTFAEEILQKHIDYCNEVQIGFFKLPNSISEFKVGDIVYAKTHPFDIIGIIYGFVYCPISNTNRAVLGINCDVMLDKIRIADKKEKIAFNLFTKDLEYIEARMTCLI